ncbi:MAG: SpoIIIAH-like family protein [Ruminococcus sp.]
MKKYKKYMLAAVLVFALGAAVYLNWSLSGTQTASKTLGETKFVNATLSTENTESNKNTEKVSAKANTNEKDETAVKLTSEQKKFFAEAETKRKQMQDSVIDKATEILDVDSTPDDQKTAAQLQVAGILKNFTLQDSIETTLQAKGLTKCLSYINDQGCGVAVLKSELNDSTSMIIKATIKSITNIDFDKIAIITV